MFFIAVIFAVVGFIIGTLVGSYRERSNTLNAIKIRVIESNLDSLSQVKIEKLLEEI